MRTLLLVLLLWSAPVWAKCYTHTYTDSNGNTIHCTTCCRGNHCSTHCEEY